MTARLKPSDKKPSRQTLLEKKIGLLESRAAGFGYAPTRLRRLVLRFLLEASGPVKAYDMVETARLEGVKLTPASIYRVLDHLQATGLVHKVNSINSFVACSHEESGSSHHPLILVCPDCRKATEINDSDLSEALFSRLASLGHEVAEGSVEIHGLCGLCSSK